MLEEFRLKQGDLGVDPLRETYLVHGSHKLVFIVFFYVVADMLKHRQDLVHFSVDHEILKHVEDCNGRLEEDKDAIKVVEVPHPSDQLEIEGSSEERHEPLVQVMLWLHVLELELLAQLW